MDCEFRNVLIFNALHFKIHNPQTEIYYLGPLGELLLLLLPLPLLLLPLLDELELRLGDSLRDGEERDSLLLGRSVRVGSERVSLLLGRSVRVGSERVSLLLGRS